MILLGNFMIAVGNLLDMVITLFIFLLIARAVLSWVNPDPYNTIVRIINSTTEPILSRVRAKVPPMGMLDMSLLVVLFGLYFVDYFVVRSLVMYGSMWASAPAAKVVGM